MSNNNENSKNDTNKIIDFNEQRKSNYDTNNKNREVLTTIIEVRNSMPKVPNPNRDGGEKNE